MKLFVNLRAMLQLSLGRKLILNDYGSGKLEDVSIRLENGEERTIGYTTQTNRLDFDDLTYEYIDDYSTEERKDFILSRVDCVSFVILAIGGNETDRYRYVDYIPRMLDYDDKYCYYEEYSNVDEYFSAMAERYIFHDPYPFLMCALFDAGIAYGEYTEGMAGANVYFNEYKFVTLEEALAFMVRCLCPGEDWLKDLNKTYEYAKDIGLIVESDAFYNSPESEITVGEMHILLERFLNCPRGGYLEFYEDALYQKSAYKIDSDGEKTYAEMLNENYGEKFAEDLLSYGGMIYTGYGIWNW